MIEDLREDEIMACLNCRKNHKKCDKKKPCTNCAKKKIECIINQKRKPTGRPVKYSDKRLRYGIIICEKCNSKNEMIAKFCIECGYKISDQMICKINELSKENEFLKRKNQELSDNLQLRKSLSTDLWFMMKLVFPIEWNSKTIVPSYILETSKSFTNLLGYEHMELNNFSFPNLIPAKMKKTFAQEHYNCIFKIEKVKGLMCQKLFHQRDFCVKHTDGHLIKMFANINIYLDPYTSLPSTSTIHVLDVCCDVEDSSMSNNILPKVHTLTFQCGENDPIPPFIKEHSESSFNNNINNNPNNNSNTRNNNNNNNNLNNNNNALNNFNNVNNINITYNNNFNNSNSIMINSDFNLIIEKEIENVGDVFNSLNENNFLSTSIDLNFSINDENFFTNF